MSRTATAAARVTVRLNNGLSISLAIFSAGTWHACRTSVAFASGTAGYEPFVAAPARRTQILVCAVGSLAPLRAPVMIKRAALTADGRLLGLGVLPIGIGKGIRLGASRDRER